MSGSSFTCMTNNSPTLTPQPAAASATAASPPSTCASSTSVSHDESAASAASVVSDSDASGRKEYTKQILLSGKFYSVLEYRRVGSEREEQLINFLREIDYTLIILHARIPPYLSDMTVLEALLALLAELNDTSGCGLSDERHVELEKWCNAINANLAVHPHETEITGSMDVCITVITRHAKKHEKASPYIQFLLDLAATLLTHQQQQISGHKFDLDVGLRMVVEQILSSCPLHPLPRTLIRLLRSHGASSSVSRGGDDDTPIHILIKQANIDALLTWMVDESDNLHEFNLKDTHDHSIQQLPYMESVLACAARKAQDCPFCTPAKLCLEVVKKVIEWQDGSRPARWSQQFDQQQHYQQEINEEAKASFEDMPGPESNMMDQEPTTAHASSSSSSVLNSSSDIRSWLLDRLTSLPKLLLSSRITNRLSNEFQEKQRIREAEEKARLKFFNFSSSSSPPIQLSLSLPPPPPTPALSDFISTLLTYPEEIHLDETDLDNRCLLSHVLMSPHSVTHILAIPTAADLFLYRIDAMSRESVISGDIYGQTAIDTLCLDIPLDDDDDESTCSEARFCFIFDLYDAVISKSIEGVGYDHSTGLLNRSHWQLSLNYRSSISGVLRIINLLRHYHIPHDYVEELLSSPDSDDTNRLCQYIQLTMTVDFLEPAFCRDGMNIYEQSFRLVPWIESNERNEDGEELARERLKIIRNAYQHFMTFIYPEIRREVDVWMISDLTEVTMEYLMTTSEVDSQVLLDVASRRKVALLEQELFGVDDQR